MPELSESEWYGLSGTYTDITGLWQVHASAFRDECLESLLLIDTVMPKGNCGMTAGRVAYQEKMSEPQVHRQQA